MNNYVAYIMKEPSTCIECPFSPKNGKDIRCCIEINACANLVVGNMLKYKSHYCPLIKLSEDSDILQDNLRKEKEFNDFYSSRSSRFD